MRVLYHTKIFFFFFTFLLLTNNSVAQAAEVTFSWIPNQNSAVQGYKIYYGLSSGTYIDAIQVTSSTSTMINGKLVTTVTGLEGNQTYFFAITAYTNNIESNYSPEIKKYVAQSSLIPRYDWRLRYVDSEELIGEDGAAVNAFDGDPRTIWHTEWKYSNPRPPHQLQIDLGANYSLEGFRYLPRQAGGLNGTVKRYALYVSRNGVNWGSPVAQGYFAANRAEKEIRFAATTGRFVRFVALSEISGRPWTSVAEINLLGKPL